MQPGRGETVKSQEMSSAGAQISSVAEGKLISRDSIVSGQDTSAKGREIVFTFKSCGPAHSGANNEKYRNWRFLVRFNWRHK